MEINRATTLAKVLARDRALDARDRKDAAIEKGRLAEVYPGSPDFRQAVEVIAQYLADLMEAKVSSVHDAHAQTNIPATGQTVESALRALHTSLETVISASVGSWGGSLALVQQRTGKTVAGGAEALAEAERELKRRADKLYEKAEAKLDVLLQSSLAASERNVVVESRNSPEVSALFDVFISHATEDKQYVEPLVEALEAAGIKVWFDKTALEWGNDLRASIDRGLANCRYGIVILSKAFLRKKKWTEYELNSLFALEQPGRKIILPIWHGITREDVLEYGAGFADRLAKVSSKDSYGDIVETLLGLLGRSIPPRSRAAGDTASVLTQPDQKQDVSEITLEAFYFNHDPDIQTFACQSVSEMPGKYVDDTSADGSVMRSELEPPLLMVRGIDVKAVESLEWKPTGLRFKDAKTGEEKVFSGQLRDTVEPDTLKFDIHGGDAKSGTKPSPQTPVTAEPVAAKPNAIAYAWYETTGENAAKAKAFIRPSTQHDGWFSFENSLGEEMHGTKEEIAMKFAAFDKSLVLKHYVRMQHSTSDPAFKVS
jgi:hypothetical protein